MSNKEDPLTKEKKQEPKKFSEMSLEELHVVYRRMTIALSQAQINLQEINARIEQMLQK